MADTTVKIKKLKSLGKVVFPATILDAVKDATKKITVDGVEKDNPYYGKTLRYIIEENEKVTATSLNELDSRAGKLTDLNTTAKGSLVAAINEVASSSSTSVGTLTDLDTDEKTSIVGAINELKGDIDTLNGGDDEDGSVAKAVKDAKDEIMGVANESGKYDDTTVNGLDARVDAIETALNVAGTDQSTIDKVDEVLTWFSGIEETDPTGAAVITAVSAVGTEASGTPGEDGYKEATGLIKKVADLESRSNVTVSATDGVSDGTNTYKYTPETGTVVDANYSHVTVSSTGVSDAAGNSYAYTPETGTVVDTNYSHITVSSTGVSDAAGNTYAYTEEANTVHDENYSHITVSATDGVSDAAGNTYKYTPETGTVVDADYAHITVTATSVSDGTTTMQTTAIADNATGIASAQAVYDYAITIEAATDTNDYEDVF